MHLKSFSTYGFKSFADKIELSFGSGITAIVGPNGSGKSNISDAIRWVLGEQSAKYLRGSKMEDVIFSGSGKRRPLGVAEVTLVFDNSDHRLSLDFDEVSITRRVFRSGDSEYSINKTNCSLKDILDLLADTGLGRGSMSIIGQNKIDEILNSRPEERRALFEEAAGIAKFRMRKKEAMRRLDDTAANLTRINDIKAEVEGQVEPLRLAAEQTRKFNLLDKELRACKLTQFVHKIENIENIRQKLNTQDAELENKVLERATAVRKLNAVPYKWSWISSVKLITVFRTISKKKKQLWKNCVVRKLCWQSVFGKAKNQDCVWKSRAKSCRNRSQLWILSSKRWSWIMTV